MKRLRLLLMTALLTVLGGGSVLAVTQQQSISVASSNTFNYCGATVNTNEGTGATTITWSSKLENFGYWVNKDITDYSKYTKLVIVVAKDGERDFPTDLQISLNKNNATYASNKYTLSEGTNEIEISSLLNSSLAFDKYSAMESIALYSSSAGSFIINSISFEYDDAIPAIVEAPAVAEDKIRYTVDLHKTGRSAGGQGHYNAINQYYYSNQGWDNLMPLSEVASLSKSDYDKVYIHITLISGGARYHDGVQTNLNDGLNAFSLEGLNLSNFRIGGTSGDTKFVINYIYFEGPKVKKIQGNEYIVKELTQNEYTGGSTNYNLGFSTTDAIYGTGSDAVSDNDKYADITDYDYLRLVVTEGIPRLFMFVDEKNKATQVKGTDPVDGKSYMTYDGVDTYLFDIKKFLTVYPHAHLGSVKPYGWGQSATVTSLTLLKKGDCGYILSGTGELTDVASALADKTLTSVDATGLTNEEAIEISTGNPNCLIIANTGKLSNPDNVLIKGADDSYSCASLSLMDANDFAAPVAFTATIAKLARDAKGYDGWATVCLPFEASVPSGVKAWEIESVNAGVLNMKSITTIPANKAVLLQFDEATGLAVYASSATVSKTVAASESGKTELVGVYAKQQAPVGSYVLQKKDGTLAFYKVETDKQPNIPAFRAYLVVNSEGAKPKMMGINFEETTGISDMQNNETILTPAMKYNMAGQSVQHMKKGVQIQRMSDGSVRKVMVK